MRFILLLFYNKNLSFYSGLLSSFEENQIMLNRFNSYSILSIIHNKLNFIFFNNNNIKLSFYYKYKIFSYIKSNNLNLNNNLTLLSFSIINRIFIKFMFNKKLALPLILFCGLYNKSISNSIILFDTHNLRHINTKGNIILKAVKIINTLPNEINRLIFNYNKYIFNKLTNSIINIKFLNRLTLTYKVMFSSSNIVKYLTDYSIIKSNILFLRKNKVFNKSRYSRNRQTYRTGAYWCLYINIIAVIAFYFWFYNFTINFGYLWWLLYFFVLSFFFFKAIKFKFYNPKNILIELKLSIKWLYLILSQIFSSKY